MADTWPLILDGVECGTVTAQRSGAYTVFTARALYSGPLKRISLYGGGAEGSLGVLAPDGDEVTLTRRLTRSQLASFPSAPEYAAESGGSPGVQPVPEREEGDGADEQEREPETAPAQDGGELWYASPDGTLSRFDGRRMLVALPSENARVPDWAKGVVRMINGREYVVFPR